MGFLGYDTTPKRKGKVNLKEIAKKFNENKKEEIIQYFNSYETLTKPNSTQNEDQAIDKVYSEIKKKYKYIYHIFNIPGVMRMNNGLFQMIGETLMIFQLFFNEYKKLDKNSHQEKFDEFFNALLYADTNKINEMLKIKMEENDLIKKKNSLEFLMDMFGDENMRNYYKEIFIGTATAEVVATTGILFGSTLVKTISTGYVLVSIGIIATIGILSFFIYRGVKDNHKKKVSNNFLKIKQFFDEVQNFLSSGVDFFCNDGDKNLFIIAIEKNEDLINDICIFPFYLKELKSTNCPTLGNNPQSNSNAEYYKIVLEACKYYVKKYTLRVYNHANGNYDYNLQKELDNDFIWLKDATMKQIKEKIKSENSEEIKYNMYKNKQMRDEIFIDVAKNLDFPIVPDNLIAKNNFNDDNITEPRKDNIIMID